MKGVKPSLSSSRRNDAFRSVEMVLSHTGVNLSDDELQFSDAVVSSTATSSHSSSSLSDVSLPSLFRHRNSAPLQDDSLSSTPSGRETSPLAPKSKTPMDSGRASNKLFLGSHVMHKRNMLSLPLGTPRKGSDFDELVAHLEKDPGDSIVRVRTRQQVVVHILIELAMLKKDWPTILFGIVFQWIHNISTNLAYYYHARLSAVQRVPLSDVAFEVLPPLKDSWWMISEYIVHGMIVFVICLIFSVIFLRWNPPHGRPMYCVSIFRRFLMTLVAAQSLRIISFLITTLPGSSRQCAYHVSQNLTLSELLNGPAPSEGNPPGWDPPTSFEQVYWRLDTMNGCGDLMFSSHTIFTVLLICDIFEYFNWRLLKWTLVWLQLIVIPLILAARKHYSVDIFTALYVVPLLFFYLKRLFPDMDRTSQDMVRNYGIRLYQPGRVAVWGHDLYMSPYDLPVDLQSSSTTARQTESLDGTESTGSSGDYNEVDIVQVV